MKSESSLKQIEPFSKKDYLIISAIIALSITIIVIAMPTETRGDIFKFGVVAFIILSIFLTGFTCAIHQTISKKTLIVASKQIYFLTVLLCLFVSTITMCVALSDFLHLAYAIILSLTYCVILSFVTIKLGMWLKLVNLPIRTL